MKHAAGVLWLLVTAAAPLFGAEPGPAPRQDAWKVIGMGGGGTMQFLTISPHDPDIVVEACDMTGGYVTTDGGNSYRMFNLRNVIYCYAFDPAKPGVIYAGNDGLWRSENNAATWSLVFPDRARGTFEHMRGDHGEHSFTTADAVCPAGGNVTITAIAVDPGNSDVVYVAFARGFASQIVAGLFVTRDRGVTWEKVRDVPGGEVLRLHVDAATGSLTCATSRGLLVLENDKWSEYAPPAGVSFDRFSIARTSFGEPVIYATAAASWKDGALAGGLYISADAGKTWKEASGGLAALVGTAAHGASPRFHAVAACPRQGEIVYIGFEGLPLANGAFNGVARSADSGATWMIVRKEGLKPSVNAAVSWLEERMAEQSWNVFFDAPRDLAVAPGDSSVCYATDLFRTYRTTDAGKTWETVTSVKVADGKWTTRGLDVTTCYGVHFDPFDPENMYVSHTDVGMFRSDDGGKSWTGSVDGVPETGTNTTYWLEFDPAVEGLVWGAFCGTHDLPRPKMWRRGGVSGYCGFVAVSTDGCKTWTPSNKGMGHLAAITHILMDPESPVGKRTLYACAFGKGVFKSTDNGASWDLCNVGIEKNQPFVWRLVRAADGALYLIVARRSSDGRIGDADDGALYRSVDGAATWSKMRLPEGMNGPNGLAVDPADPRRMYLAAWGKMNPGAGDSGGGVFLTTDGGATWRHVMDEDQHIYDVTLDPRNGRLYACGFESAAYRSDDRGATWTRLRGFNFKWGHRVIPDPYDEDMVYIATFGGSVWYGPAAGDPGAVEDIVTPITRKP